MKIKKDEEIKARVDGTTKASLWQISLRRGLDLSDIVREALREKIQKENAKPARA